ncbi:hypothetical protein U0355_01220 [Salimicrobium sp. PL1-032A]|uniref:hypothetical protein n=1 Tax=Salimicrobium sp. PL1-032A TaxID=3095364 RepID=UPI0032613A86
MTSGYTDRMDWMSELEKPEVQESLTQLLKKIPDIQRSIDSAEEMLAFGQSVMKDKEMINDFEERFTYSTLTQENLEALISLLGKLPMLLELAERLEQITVFIENVLGDQTSLDTLFESFSAQPLARRGKEALTMVETIKEKAEATPQQQISIFTVLKWIKDPNVQKGLHYIQTTMDVLNKSK